MKVGEKFAVCIENRGGQSCILCAVANDSVPKFANTVLHVSEQIWTLYTHKVFVQVCYRNHKQSGTVQTDTARLPSVAARLEYRL